MNVPMSFKELVDLSGVWAQTLVQIASKKVKQSNPPGLRRLERQSALRPRPLPGDLGASGAARCLAEEGRERPFV